MITELVIAAIVFGAVLGVSHRTLLPYFRKAQAAAEAGQELKFKAVYGYTLLLSLAGAIPAIFALLMTLLRDVAADESAIMGFIGAYLAGYAFNNITNDEVASSSVIPASTGRHA